MAAETFPPKNEETRQDPPHLLVCDWLQNWSFRSQPHPFPPNTLNTNNCCYLRKKKRPGVSEQGERVIASVAITGGHHRFSRRRRTTEDLALSGWRLLQNKDEGKFLLIFVWFLFSYLHDESKP